MSSTDATGGPRFFNRKCVLLGESAVGKSSLVMRFVKDQFEEHRESTIGAAFRTQSVTLGEADDEAGQTTIKFEIWDTAGQERYKSLAPMYYRNADCAIVVYDVTVPSSLDKAKEWIRELNRQAEPNIVIALVGNKIDLLKSTSTDDDEEDGDEDAPGTVNVADVTQFAEESGLLPFRASAKTGEGVTEIFVEMAKKLPLNVERRSVANAGQPGRGVDLNAGGGGANGADQPCAC